MEEQVPAAVPVGEQVPIAVPDVQQQLLNMQNLMNLQMQALQAQTKLIAGNQQVPTPHSTLVKNGKVPEGRYTMSLSEFQTFRKDCEDYKALTSYSDPQIVMQIRLNTDVDLKRAIDTNYPLWNTYTVSEAVKKIGEIVSHVSNTSVYKKQFDEMCQKENETIREYITSLRSCAIDCNFVCPYDETHDLCDYHIINRVKSGVYDKVLQQELLQHAETIKTLPEITQYCENFESAKKDRELLSQAEGLNPSICTVETEGLNQEEIIAAISNYKKQKNTNVRSKGRSKNCGRCGYGHAVGNCPAYGSTCKGCGKPNHFEQVCRDKLRREKVEADKEIAALVFSTIQRLINSSGNINTLPKIKPLVSTPVKSVHLDSIADTGAQVPVGGLKQMKQLGISEENLRKVPHILKHAGGKHLKVAGVATVTLTHNNTSVKTDVYFAPAVSYLYLSLDNCKDLNLVHRDFPHVDVNANSAEGTPTINNIDTDTELSTDTKHTVIPERPKALPFPPVEENVPMLEKWLLDKFGKLCFDIDIEPLPPMNTKEQHFHLQKDHRVYTARTPIPVAYHWKDDVDDELDGDVRKGILRKVGIGEKTGWCLQMIVVPKHDGRPRRTVDFQPLNKFIDREIHYTPTPFQVVSSIPSRMYKTIMDAYNGYHQVPLDKESSKLTTFITEKGLYQYLRAPQGHVSSGDAYTHAYDEIVKDVPRMKKITDDVCLYDPDLETAFYHAFDYLVLCSENGITLNPTKFRFGRREVEFVGYHVGWDDYRPADHMLAAIKDFPMPAEPTISDIRAWFGLVNQIAPFVIKTPVMEPFRELLKSSNAVGSKVHWDGSLQEMFEKSKKILVEQAVKGLQYYDPARETILMTDWSKSNQGIGFILLQKHCSCKADNEKPLCCDKWKLVLCDSRTCKKAELNYAPIEGEALAIAWAMKKAKLFLLGNKFKVVTDHNPLVRILADKSLADIENNRLLSLKEKMMPYSFSIHYIKGKENFADVFSRYPATDPTDEDLELAEDIEIASINSIRQVASSIAITNRDIEEAALCDEQYQKVLSKVLRNEFAKTNALEESCVREFFNVRERLSVLDGQLMYNYEGKHPRLVIPKSLRGQVILNLHAANQGATSILARARHDVYWPGLDRDINIHVSTCASCREIAPSQQKEPLITAPVPQYPFQHTVADLFEREGYKYLAYADRLTGYAELAHFPASTVSSIIINTFREYFHRWGVPEEVSLDGGPNVASNEISNWLEDWGVSVRRSSAYYPQSNGRAEAAVKSLKRLLMGNTGRNGSINTDQVAKALLQYRNTPLRGIDRSPAELALGRKLKDSIPLPRARYEVDPNWRKTLKLREQKMSRSNTVMKDKYDINSRELSDLPVRMSVLCQNPHTNRWDKSGTITEVLDNRQYYVKMDGSGRLTLRNRRHLRPILVARPVTPMLEVSQPPEASLIPKEEATYSHANEHSALTDNQRHSITIPQVPPPTADTMLSNQPGTSLAAHPDISAPPSSPADVVVPLRKSTRLRQKPVRYR